MADKPFDQMTIEELRTERERWDRNIRNATQWGASVKAATDFRNACDVWIARRERESDSFHHSPRVVRDPELAAVLAELQRASACLIRIEELLNKPKQPKVIVVRPSWWEFWR